jgi:hypothetical protein
MYLGESNDIRVVLSVSLQILSFVKVLVVE